MKRLARENTVPWKQRYKVLTPVMTIEPGETIIVETKNHMTPVVRSEADLHPHKAPEYIEREETGPIYVTGAKPGDMLSVKIEKIEVEGLPHALGRGPLEDRYPQIPHIFPYKDGRIHFPGGMSIAYAPMIGDIYNTPPHEAKAGDIGDHGGNMDVTEVKPGNTLYLPVYHEGGLLVLGDVHAAQGDGEIFGEAAETAANVTVTVDIDRKYRNPRPFINTPNSLICLASRPNYWDSLKLAIEDMIRLLGQFYGMSEEDAYIYSTMVGSARQGACLADKYAVCHIILIVLEVPKPNIELEN